MVTANVFALLGLMDKTAKHQQQLAQQALVIFHVKMEAQSPVLSAHAFAIAPQTSTEETAKPKQLVQHQQMVDHAKMGVLFMGLPVAASASVHRHILGLIVRF